MDKLITLDFTGVSDEETTVMVNKIKADIAWIASGARDRYEYKHQLEQFLKTWGREFAVKIKEFGFHHLNTNYSSWEYRRGKALVDVFYVLQRTTFKSADDFSVQLGHRIGNDYVTIGWYKTPEELVQAMKENNLY